MLNNKKINMAPPPEPEKSLKKDRTSVDSISGSVPVPCPNLARMLTALELRDDHQVDKSMFQKPLIESELESIRPNEHDSFIGILARCKINGCDVHALNSSLEIHNHYRENESIEEEFQKARAVAANLPESIIAILVFKNHISYLYQNGKVEVICEE